MFELDEIKMLAHNFHLSFYETIIALGKFSNESNSKGVMKNNENMVFMLHYPASQLIVTNHFLIKKIFFFRYVFVLVTLTLRAIRPSPVTFATPADQLYHSLHLANQLYNNIGQPHMFHGLSTKDPGNRLLNALLRQAYTNNMRTMIFEFDLLL